MLHHFKYQTFAFWLNGDWSCPARIFKSSKELTPLEAFAAIKKQRGNCSSLILQPVFKDEQQEKEYLQAVKRASNSAWHKGEQEIGEVA